MTKKIFSYTLIIAALMSNGCNNSSAPVIDLKSGPQLFIDDYLIAEQTMLNRSVNNPDKLPDPIAWGGWDKDQVWQPYFSVVQDEETGRFRLWYNTPVDTINHSRCRIAYMESEDGINWNRPHQVLEDPHYIQFGVSVVDHGKDWPDQEARFVLGSYTSYENPGLRISTSANGTDWSVISEKASFAHNHDINSLHWDPLRERYIAFASHRKVGYEDKDHPFQNDDRRRIPHQSVGSDLETWEEIKVIFEPKLGVPIEKGETQFYSMGGMIVRGDLLIGLVKVLRDDLNATQGKSAKELGDMKRKAAGIGYTVLAWSRDGETWHRDHEPFLDRNPVPGTFDHAMAWGDEQLIVGDKTYIYYGGYERGHKVRRFDERHLGFASIGKDRYVSRDADLIEGRLLTKALNISAESLTVNARIYGTCKVRLVSVNSNPIPGFDWVEISGDSVAHEIKWAKSISSLNGKAVRLEFKLTKAQLFGFDVI